MTYGPSLVAVDQRTWTDLNGDDIGQENEIGPTSNTNFGVRRNQNPDPNISRPYQVVADLGIQHQLFPRFGLTVSYDYRRFYNTIWTTNLALDIPVDYTLLSVPDPRGGGQPLPVYNLAPGKLGLINELDANSSTNTTWYKGVDVSLNYRAQNLTLLGGVSIGRTLSSTCQVEDPNSLRFCDQSSSDVPLRTQFKLAGTYVLPYDIHIGANFQSQPGAEQSTTYAVVRSILPSLTQTSVNVRLNEPGSTYLDRVNQLERHAVEVVQAVRCRRPPGVVAVQHAECQCGPGADQHVRTGTGKRHDDSESTTAACRRDNQILDASDEQRRAAGCPARNTTTNYLKRTLAARRIASRACGCGGRVGRTDC
ncbi:MAG: hypothetical protein ABJA98_25835 [Acidobacteriota bacterium]